MSDLTEFLLARIAEDEAVARAAIEDDGGEDGGFEGAADRLTWQVHDPQPNRFGAAAAQLIARTAVPRRVLAECVAKRRILDAYKDERQRMDIYNRDYPLGLLTTEGDLRARLSSNARWAGLDVAVRALVQPYADHPDHDEAWRP